MRVLGIIAEYNPFHYGHLYHLLQSKKETKADYTIAVMSGHFTQRGEAAMVDKWIRAEAAVNCGIDLVLELPVVYAVQTAELFAYGGIQMLNNTGLVTHISFGSETGNLSILKQIADILVAEDIQYKELLRNYLSNGLSYPAARYNALLDYIKYSDSKKSIYDCLDLKMIKKALSGSNSILAIEYLKALKITNSNIIPITIPRIKSSYSDTRIKKGISSATSIRKEILKNGMNMKVRNALPEKVYNSLSDFFDQGMGPVDNNHLGDLFLGIVRRSRLDEIASWVDVKEGLENRIKENAQKATNLKEFLTMVKTKRYPLTRLQRIVIQGLLNLTETDFQDMHRKTGPPYLRILAFSNRALPLLKKLKKTAHVPVITKAAHINRYGADVQKMFAYDCLATDLYALAINNPSARQGGRDFIHQLKPLIYP